MKLDEITIEQLLEELSYLYVNELYEISETLKLKNSKKKAWLMQNIASYLLNNIEIAEVIMPKNVYGDKEELTIDSKMFYNRYRNDLVTRNFFKSHIGPHFHFTVFGIDWLNFNWINGIVPTYKDFIEMWINNYKRNSGIKYEWAYIRFIQGLKGKFSQNEINKLWKNRRDEAKVLIMELCRKKIQSK